MESGKTGRTGMNIGYIRVSSIKQNKQRQYDVLEKYHIDKYYEEEVSGKNINDRIQLQKMLDFVREGDVVYVAEFSRLARNAKDMMAIIEYLNQKNVRIVSDMEKLDTRTDQGYALVSIIAGVSAMEREYMLERQAEGIAAAKKAGKYKGGHPKNIDPTTFEAFYELYMKRKINKSEYAKRLKISRPTLDKYIKEYEKNGHI